MSVIFHVNSCVRANSNEDPEHNAISKNRAKKIMSRFKEEAHIDECIYRDVGVHAPKFITQDWIGSAFTPESERTSQQHQWRK